VRHGDLHGLPCRELVGGAARDLEGPVLLPDVGECVLRGVLVTWMVGRGRVEMVGWGRLSTAWEWFREMVS
jgi:hypothetical protein